MVEEKPKTKNIRIPVIIVGIVIVIVIAILLLANGVGYFSSSGSPSGNNEYNIINQGINDAEQNCINNLPRGSSTEGCLVSPSDRETVIPQVISFKNGLQNKCLAKLPRSKSESECIFSDSDLKTLFGSAIVPCYSSGTKSSKSVIGIYAPTMDCVKYEVTSTCSARLLGEGGSTKYISCGY